MIGTIVWAVVSGAVLGAIGRLILPGRQRISWWAMILVGIVAAFLGGLVAQFLGVGHTRGIDWIKHGIQVGLAVLGIAIVAGSSGRGSRQGH